MYVLVKCIFKVYENILHLKYAESKFKCSPLYFSSPYKKCAFFLSKK